MPQERSPEHHTDFFSRSSLPNRLEREPRRDQPLGGVPIFAEGTSPPPYPQIVDDDDITEDHIGVAAQELLSYIGGMRQRAEQRANRSRTNVVSPPERKPESDSA